MNTQDEIIAFSKNFGKGIANDSRFKILGYLTGGSHTVNEIADFLGASQSTTSQHLLVLKNGHLIINEKRGLYVYYSLNYEYMLDGLKAITALIEHKSTKEKK